MRGVPMSRLQMMAKVDIVARDIGLTPALSDRVQSKIGKVIDKLGHDALSTNVVLRVVKYPVTEHHTQTTKPESQIAEVTVAFRGGAVLVASERTDDMYASIDLVSHKLARSIKKHNEKINDKHKKERAAFKSTVDEEIAADFDEEELLKELDSKYRSVTPAQAFKKPLQLVKPKSFVMPPISVEEAVHALDIYVDHPFYVFRNKETNEINVVYRRNEGGVGLIKPEA
eukprot:gene1535-1673_t